VTAQTNAGATFTGYAGRVRFTSSDALAGLPADYQFTPADGGVKSFTVTLRSAGGRTVTVTDAVLPVTTTVGVNVVNTPPTAADDSLTVAEDAAAVVAAVLANDSSAPDVGEVLAVTAVTPATHGTVTLVGGVVRYAPAANYFGPDSFTYTVSDGNGGEDTATVSVTVTPVNDPPTPGPDTLTVAEDDAAAVADVLANDSFAPDAGEALSVVAVGQPAHGTVTLVGGVVRYAPAADYVGTDSFTYTLSDGNGGTATGTVAVTVAAVNDPPTAGPDTLTVVEDALPTIVDVLANDTSDPEPGETLVVALVGQPQHGTVTLVGGMVRYAPAADYFGTDSFTYTVSDGNGGSAVGTVTVTVTPVNDPPTVVADTLSVGEDSTDTVLPVLANDSSAPDGGEALSVTAVGQAAHGVVTLVVGVVRYTPTANYFGADSFTYTVSDGNGGTATATVTVTVTPVNDLPTANPDTLTVAEDDPATAVAVLGNDSSAPDGGETLSVSAVGQPAHGVVTLVGGVVRYAPAANYFGPDAFTYTLSDGNGGTATGTVTVTVTPVNDPPAPHPDTLVVAEDAAATVVDVLDNDSSGPETGETLVVVSVTQPTHGTITLVGGVVRYTPTANYTGADFFAYTVSDGNGEASIGSVAVTVTPVNDPPTAAPDAFTVDPGAPSTLVVLANDSSAPDAGETLTVIAVTQPAVGGAVALTPGGTVVFTPADGFVGDATFTYTVGDGTPGSTATAIVTVTVQPGGLGPVRPVAVGGGTDGSVRIVAPDGSVSGASPFGNTGAPTRTASADLNND
ncbi:tandem-95 repeat protein, partial [bacterium]|nr:tandem-95 repeat protein [bacterium]